MDINKVTEELKNEYSCQLITTINYADHEIIKALESSSNGMSYRYFRIAKNGQLMEIIDELLLAYLKRENEITEEDNY